MALPLIHRDRSVPAWFVAPADACKWAKGQPIQGNKTGAMFQIKTPLDFYAVSDHAEMMGTFVQMLDPNNPLSQHPMARKVLSDDQNVAV